MGKEVVEWLKELPDGRAIEEISAAAGQRWPTVDAASVGDAYGQRQQQRAVERLEAVVAGPPLPCWVALMCEHRGWLLAAAGRALSPCHRDGLGRFRGGVATRRGWVPATSEWDMHRSCGAGCS